jgi:ABC-type bacteriocin/lantibiotic exporter with double-glycine peptidase domain
MNYSQSLRYLLGASTTKIIPLILLFLIVSLGDLIGISAIGAYLTLLFDPSVIERFDAYQFSNFVKGYNHSEIMIFFGILMIGIFLLKFIIVLISQYFILAFAANEKAKIQKQIIDGILNQKYENFLFNKAGDNLSSIANLSSYYAECLQAIFQSVSGMIVILAVLIFFGVTNFSSLLMLLGMVGFILVIFNLIFAKRLAYQGESFVRGTSSMLQGTTDISKGLKEIKTFGKEKFFMRLIVDAANTLAKASIRLSFASIIPRNLIEVVLMLLIVSIVGMNISNGVDISSMFITLGMFVAGVVRIAPLLSSLQTSWNTLIFSKEPIMRLSLLLQKQDMGTVQAKTINREVAESRSKINQEEFGYLKLEKICYRYPNSEKNALDDITLEIQKGDFIGLIGSSGSGKTSLINLILGFLEPTSGEMRFNNYDVIKNIDSWRAKCAYLPQDIFLIEGTLIENITLEKKIKSPELLDQAIKMSKLSNFIETLPNGLETNMGDGGIRLSGGQKQRVAIARSIYHEREVLMLDESTSALDPTTEEAVMAELVAMRNHKTIIAIAHRLSTLKECNKIYRLNQGCIEGPLSYKEIEDSSNGG